MRKILTLLTVLMLFSAFVYSQSRTVSGTIRDEKGNPVPFATVTEIGTKNATQADANGAFTLKVSGSNGFTISATGHQSQTVTAQGNALAITLATTDSRLTEVVVTTAFGIKRSQRVTPYSSQVIGDQQLHIIPQTSINSALAGKIAGVQFRGQSPMKLNSEGFLRIRGGLDLTGDVAPVYVIDGSITGSFDINPDDIEDVTVLKGANATTLFGDAAKGGAVVITTKKAAAGKSSIELNEGITFDNVYVLPLYQNKYGGGGASDFFTFTWQPGMPDAWKTLDGKHYPDYTDDASWGPRLSGQEYIPWYAWNPNNPESGKTASWLPQPNNAKDFYRTGVTSNTNVSFAKSAQGSSIRLSYTNQSIRGMLPNSSSFRNTVFATFSYDLGAHFTVNTNLTYTNNVINGEFDDSYANRSSGSFNSWFHRDLDINKLRQYAFVKTPIGTYQSWNLAQNPSGPDAVEGAWRGNFWYNYFTYFNLINDKQNRDNLVGNVSLTYKVTNNIKVTGTVRKNTNTTFYENILPTEIENAAVQTGDKASFATGNLNGASLQSPSSNSFDVLASFNKSFLENRLGVNVNAGASDVRNKFYSVEEATKNGLNVPGLYAVSNSKDQPALINNRNRWENRALFATADLEWNHVIDVTGAIRNDWYSVLLPTNNNLLSPSAGVSFFFSDYTKNALPWLSYGKVFGSWGKKPTSGLAPYATNFTYAINPNKWGDNFLTTVPNQAINPNIQGALLTTYEAGVDLKFLNNRFGLNATYYNETSRNAPVSVSVSGYSGFNKFLTNVSLIKRTGIELVLDARVINRKDFNWQVTKTFSYLISNPVVETDTAGSNIQISSGAFFSGIVPPKVYQVKGKSWGQLIGTAIKRNADGLPELDPVTGLYATEENHDFGSVVPKITGGLVNTLTYKNFVLNFNIDYQFGGKFFSLSEMWGTFSGLLAPTAATNDKGWNVRDDVSVGGGVHVVGVSSVDHKTPVDMYVDAQTYFHWLGSGNAIADYFVHSLSYVKLREVGLGYQLPVEKFGIKWVKGITATAVARNPLLIYRETRNFDPSEISGVFGEDGQFPGTRGMGFNLKLNF